MDGIAPRRNVTETKPSFDDTSRDEDVSSRHIPEEGMAILLLNGAQAAPRLWDPTGAGLDADRDQADTISFVCTDDKAYPAATAASHALHKASVFREFRIPLANTIFRTGQSSTCFAQRFSLTRNADEGLDVRPLSSRSLKKQTIVIQGFPSNPRCSACKSDLRPITEPRVVKAAVGNILRTLQDMHEAMPPFPASHELEAAVARQRVQRLNREQRPGVWALVQPREVLQKLGKSVESTDLLRHFDSGARLHKILSGGGGWGSKQGLLSLDPICKSELSESESNSSVPPWLRETEDGLGFQTFEQTVKPGDLVTFFAAQEYTTSASTWIPEPHQASLAFGICSALDDECDSHPKDVADNSVHVEVNHFGISSSKGLELIVSAVNSKNDGKPSTQDELLVRTKLDAPNLGFHQWRSSG